jgi:hypothetical protein
MKNKYIILLFVFFGGLLCVALTKETATTIINYRVKLLEHNRGLYLFDVDHHLYVANSNGGVIHAESCGCKK